MTEINACVMMFILCSVFLRFHYNSGQWGQWGLWGQWVSDHLTSMSMIVLVIENELLHCIPLYLRFMACFAPMLYKKT